jgi:hypothetical protein
MRWRRRFHNLPTHERIAMAPPRVGRKTGRKSELTSAQTELLESYGERFQTTSGHNAFYTEVLNKWLEKFSYTGLNPKSKSGVAVAAADLRLDVEDLDTLGQDERNVVIERRELARNALRTVSSH